MSVVCILHGLRADRCANPDGFAEAAGGSYEYDPIKCTLNELVRMLLWRRILTSTSERPATSTTYGPASSTPHSSMHRRAGVAVPLRQ